MRQLDFAAYEETVTDLNREQILFHLDDIQATLPHADAMDRVDGEDRGGFYRDQASVLRRELAKRAR